MSLSRYHHTIMKSSYIAMPTALVAVALAAPQFENSKRALPKLYLAGDSTMALGGGGTGTQGTSNLSTLLT